MEEEKSSSTAFPRLCTNGYGLHSKWHNEKLRIKIDKTFDILAESWESDNQSSKILPISSRSLSMAFLSRQLAISNLNQRPEFETIL